MSALGKSGEIKFVRMQSNKLPCLSATAHVIAVYLLHYNSPTLQQQMMMMKCNWMM